MEHSAAQGAEIEWSSVDRYLRAEIQNRTITVPLQPTRPAPSFELHSRIAFRSYSILLQAPHPILLYDLHPSILIKTYSPSFHDRPSSYRVFEGWQTSLVQFIECHLAIFKRLHGVHELLEADVAVAALAAEVAFLVWCVFPWDALV